MAEQAAKEPTMEEILASIRKIISEGGEPEGETVQTETLNVETDTTNIAAIDAANSDEAFDVSELLEDAGAQTADNENDHLLSIDELLGNDDLDFGDIDDLASLETADLDISAHSEDVSAEPQVELDAGFDDNTPSFEELTADIEEISNVSYANSPAPEPTPAPETIAQTPVKEAAMAQAEPITRAAPAAPSALGAVGTGNAIEGLVAELMKPMIKEWIDTNLPTMVESRVEAEIQQIANKVIAALRD